METEEGRDKFPPILLYRDEAGNLWLADGFHRTSAALRRKFTSIRAIIRPGTKADAIWEAAKINGRNGLPLADTDYRRAVEIIVAAWPDRSNVMIAEALGCDEKTVRKYRPKSESDSSEPEKRTGKDGKSYPARRKTVAEKPVSASKENKSEAMDSPVSVPPVLIQPVTGTDSNESPAVEITEQRSTSPDRNTVSQYDQKLMRWLPLHKDREKGEQPDNIIHIPLSDSDRLVACLFEEFDTQFREKVLDTLICAMLANDGKESVHKVIAPLCDNIRKSQDDTDSGK